MEKMPAYTAFYALLLRNLTNSLIEAIIIYQFSMVKKTKVIISKIFFESAGFIWGFNFVFWLLKKDLISFTL